MAFPELVDLRIATEAADLQITQHQRDLLAEHFGRFLEKIGDLDQHSLQALRIFQETLEEIEGASEAYALEDVLIGINLKRIEKNLKL